MLIPIWIALSGVAAVIAKRKNRSAWGFFLLSIFLTPFVGLTAAAFAKPSLAGRSARAPEEHHPCGGVLEDRPPLPTPQEQV